MGVKSGLFILCEMAETQIRKLEVDVIVRCSASAYDEYIYRFYVLVPSSPTVSNVRQ